MSEPFHVKPEITLQRNMRPWASEVRFGRKDPAVGRYFLVISVEVFDYPDFIAVRPLDEPFCTWYFIRADITDEWFVPD